MAEVPAAEDAGESPVCPLLGRKESHAGQLADPAGQLPVFLITPPDTESSGVGWPLGYPEFPDNGHRLGGLGASLRR